MWLQRETMLCFSVKVVFKEVSEYDDGSIALQVKEKDGNSFEGNFGEENLNCENDQYELPSSQLQKDDGNMEVKDVQEDPEERDETMQKHDGHQDSISPEKEMENKTQDEVLRSWFKITIPSGKKYDKTWLMNSIQSHCSVPFTPVDFKYIKKRAQFFVQDASTASALKNMSYKISDEENKKICVFVNPSTEPPSRQNRFTPEQMEQLKLTMKKRYDVSQQALNLHKLRFDPDLMDRDIDMILNRRNCMVATLQIIERNFPKLMSLNLCNNKLYQLDGLSDVVEKAPHIKILNLAKNELKSAWELHKVKGLKLEELWLEGNPLCSTFPEKTAYVSAIQDCFPQLLRLDGQELPPSILVDIEFPKIIKPCKESYKGSETLKTLVLQFLLLYYLIYDYGDRQGLLSAYHDEACFSLAIPFDSSKPDPNGLDKYFKDNRNMKRLKDRFLQIQLLKHTKCDIVNCLSLLPKTQHDFNSYVVDLCVYMETMLCFSINGVFKEVEGKSEGCVRAFTRTFILTSDRNSSLCIVNDQMIVRNASPKEIQSTFSIPVPIPSSISEPAQSQEQQEMVQALSTQSEMNLECSQKSLEVNE